MSDGTKRAPTEAELAATETKSAAGPAPTGSTAPHSLGSDKSLPRMEDEAKNWREFERWTRRQIHDLQLQVEHLTKALDGK